MTGSICHDLKKKTYHRIYFPLSSYIKIYYLSKKGFNVSLHIIVIFVLSFATNSNKIMGGTVVGNIARTILFNLFMLPCH